MPGQRGGTGERFDWELATAHPGSPPLVLSGGLDPDNVGEAIDVATPFAVDVASGVEAEPGRKDHDKLARFFAAVERSAAPVRWGPTRPSRGTRGAVRPLRRALRARDADAGAGRARASLARGARGHGFRAELDGLLATYVGRPSPLYHARRLSDRCGHDVFLKREDLLHTGAHKINNALGQALLAKRLGKGRVIAETGAGQHGVAVATVCALLGPECVVYMGTEDMRRQRPNVERMGLLGARGGAGRSGRTHAQGGGQRGDPRLGRERLDHALRDRLRGRPRALSRRSCGTSSA